MCPDARESSLGMPCLPLLTNPACRGLRHGANGAGVSADRAGKGGALVFLDARDLSLVRRLAVPGSCLGGTWDANLNQIFVAAGAVATSVLSCNLAAADLGGGVTSKACVDT